MRSVEIQIQQILGPILSISHSSQTLKLLIFRIFCRQISHLKWILLFLKFLVDIFLPFIELVFLSDLLVNLVLLNHFFVHVWLKTIPSVFFALVIFEDDIFILSDVIWGNFLVCVLCTDFSWSLGTVFFCMTHCATVLACSFTVGCGLITFLDLIVWRVDLGFGLEWGYVDGLAFSFVILCVPRDFLDVLWSVLH